MSGRWAGGGHGRRLGQTGWERQKENQQTLAAHGGICHVCGKPGADRVDHVIPLAVTGPAGNVESNRRPIHENPCHKQKIAAEAAAGRAKKSRLRPKERHPGMVDP